MTKGINTNYFNLLLLLYFLLYLFFHVVKMLDCIDKSMIIEETINKRYDNIKFECLLDNGKLNASCKKCNHSWPTSVRNATVFHLACYNCHKGKGYSMDKIKILKYLHENYMPNDYTLGLPSQEVSMLLETLRNQKASEIRIVPLDLLCIISVTASPGKRISMIK